MDENTTQVLHTVESVGQFVAGFFPGAAPAVTIAEAVIPLVAQGAIALYDAIMRAKPAAVTDDEWRATLLSRAQTMTVDDYLAEAKKAIEAAPQAPA